jgi:hypothetical protein
MNSIRKFFLTSFVLAAIGPAGLLLFPGELFAVVAFAVIPLWGVLFAIAIHRHGIQALWLLLVLPLLCYVPFLFWEWGQACAQNVKACP